MLTLSYTQAPLFPQLKNAQRQRRSAPPPPTPLVPVPTRKDLTPLEQEWYLLHAMRSPDRHAQQIRWAVAMCWEAYVQARVYARYGSRSLEEQQDLHQSGLLGVYRAACRYRQSGNWTSCVYYGVRLAIFQEGHRQQVGAWVGEPTQRVLSRLRQKQASSPTSPLSAAAGDLSMSVPDLRIALAANAMPASLDAPVGDDLCGARLGDLLAADDDLEGEVMSRLDTSRNTEALSVVLSQLPPDAYELLANYWGLDGRPAQSVRCMARRGRMHRAEIWLLLQHLLAHLNAAMTGVSGAPYQPPVKFVLGRLAHETYSQSYVTWAEVKSDLELRSRSEALMLANGHARRQGLPHLIDEDKHRCSTEVRVRNEDCYQLAAQGYTWGEIARLAGVDSEDNACRHARTFAYRARRDDG